MPVVGGPFGVRMPLMACAVSRPRELRGTGYKVFVNPYAAASVSQLVSFEADDGAGPCRGPYGGVAFLEAIRDLSVDQMFPPLGVSEMLPAMLRVEHGALTADRSHGAVMLNALHRDLPAFQHVLNLR